MYQEKNWYYTVNILGKKLAISVPLLRDWKHLLHILE